MKSCLESCDECGAVYHYADGHCCYEYRKLEKAERERDEALERVRELEEAIHNHKTACLSDNEIDECWDHDRVLWKEAENAG